MPLADCIRKRRYLRKSCRKSRSVDFVLRCGSHSYPFSLPISSYHLLNPLRISVMAFYFTLDLDCSMVQLESKFVHAADTRSFIPTERQGGSRRSVYRARTS